MTLGLRGWSDRRGSFAGLLSSAIPIERGRSVLAVVTSHVLRSYARRLPGVGRPCAVWHLGRPTNPERSVVRTCLQPLPPRPLPPPHLERLSPSSACQR